MSMVYHSEAPAAFLKLLLRFNYAMKIHTFLSFLFLSHHVECFKQVIDTFGALHIVCNNAGILDEIEWEKTLQVNLVSMSGVFCLFVFFLFCLFACLYMEHRDLILARLSLMEKGFILKTAVVTQKVKIPSDDELCESMRALSFCQPIGHSSDNNGEKHKRSY